MERGQYPGRPKERSVKTRTTPAADRSQFPVLFLFFSAKTTGPTADATGTLPLGENLLARYRRRHATSSGTWIAPSVCISGAILRPSGPREIRGNLIPARGKRHEVRL
jgi:hypothetical protein